MGEEASPTNPLNFGPSNLLACDREKTAHVLRMAAAWKENPPAKELLSRDGFSVEALKAALYFVGTTKSFTEALNKSIRFAGPVNYCPVLVGALAGAVYKASAIPDEAIAHCKPDVIKRCRDVAMLFGRVWTEQEFE